MWGICFGTSMHRDYFHLDAQDSLAHIGHLRCRQPGRGTCKQTVGDRRHVGSSEELRQLLVSLACLAVPNLKLPAKL